ncbi:MAG TPA: EamA family transporter [Bacillota bacterium]|nr:EamA family transporter [Bacillota bacterium]
MRNPVLLIAIGATLWGTIGWYVRHLNAYGFTPMEVVTLRMWSTALLLIVYFICTSPSTFRLNAMKDVLYFIGTGICSILFFNYSLFSAIHISTIPIATTLLYTAPAFVTILSFFLFKEPITRMVFLSLIVTFIGICLVSGLLPFNPSLWNVKAIIFGLGAGLGFSLYSIFGKFALRKYSSTTITLYTFIIAAVAMIPFFPYKEKSIYLTEPKVILLAIGIGLLPTAVAFLLFTYGLQLIEASKAAIISTIEPIVAILIGLIIFKEVFTMSQFIGMICIITAVIYTQWHQHKRTISYQATS